MGKRKISETHQKTYHVLKMCLSDEQKLQKDIAKHLQKELKLSKSSSYRHIDFFIKQNNPAIKKIGQYLHLTTLPRIEVENEIQFYMDVFNDKEKNETQKIEALNKITHLHTKAMASDSKNDTVKLIDALKVKNSSKIKQKIILLLEAIIDISKKEEKKEFITTVNLNEELFLAIVKNKSNPIYLRNSSLTILGKLSNLKDSTIKEVRKLVFEEVYSDLSSQIRIFFREANKIKPKLVLPLVFDLIGYEGKDKAIIQDRGKEILNNLNS